VLPQLGWLVLWSYALAGSAANGDVIWTLFLLLSLLWTMQASPLAAARTALGLATLERLRQPTPPPRARRR
jgi:hypothetical protein